MYISLRSVAAKYQLAIVLIQVTNRKSKLLFSLDSRVFHQKRKEARASKKWVVSIVPCACETSISSTCVCVRNLPPPASVRIMRTKEWHNHARKAPKVGEGEGEGGGPQMHSAFAHAPAICTKGEGAK